jgi:hypothetical protein
MLAWHTGFIGQTVNIYRSEDGVIWEHINYGYPNGVYLDSYEIKPGTKYMYYVTGVPKIPCANPTANNSDPSNVATVKTYCYCP